MVVNSTVNQSYFCWYIRVYNRVRGFNSMLEGSITRGIVPNKINDRWFWQEYFSFGSFDVSPYLMQSARNLLSFSDYSLLCLCAAFALPRGRYELQYAPIPAPLPRKKKEWIGAFMHLASLIENASHHAQWFPGLKTANVMALRRSTHYSVWEKKLLSIRTRVTRENHSQGTKN